MLWSEVPWLFEKSQDFFAKSIFWEGSARHDAGRTICNPVTHSHGYRGRFRTRHILASLEGKSRILRARLAASIQSRILQARILQARLAASIQSRVLRARILRARLVASIQSCLAASSRARLGTSSPQPCKLAASLHMGRAISHPRARIIASSPRSELA